MAAAPDPFAMPLPDSYLAGSSATVPLLPLRGLSGRAERVDCRNRETIVIHNNVNLNVFFVHS